MNKKTGHESKLKIRIARERDASLVLEFIKSLAQFERLSNEVKATERLIRENIFKKKYAEAVIAEYDGTPVGFAIFFHNFSTFLGRPGIYLEDLFVKPEYRGKGIGKQLLVYLAKLARRRNCGRLEWAVLDWNEKAIAFYESLGARQMKEWIVNRVTDESLRKLANK